MKKVLYIGNKLDNEKCNVSSISILGALLEKEGYELFYSSSKQNKFLRLLDMLYTCFAKRKQVDYVIIDTYSTWNFYFALAVSQLCRIFSLKYISRLNGGNLPMRLKKYPLLSNMVFKHTYKMVSPSMYLKEVFESYGYKEVLHIPNSIEIDLYKFLRKDLQEIKLLWVRSFSEIYNPRLAIQVLYVLKMQGFQAELCMVGPDSEDLTDDLKLLAKKLDVEVDITGKLSKEKWLTLSKNYNIFINTTKFDNTPVSVIEAMAVGLPIVSTNVGGMPFLIDHGKDGLLVQSNNAKKMAKAIIKLYQNPNLIDRLTLKARKKVEQYDWEMVKHQWLDILS